MASTEVVPSPLQIRDVLSSAQHVPVGPRVRFISASNVCYVHIYGHGMGQAQLPTQHRRVYVLQIRDGGIVAFSSINDISCFQPGFNCRKQR